MDIRWGRGSMEFIGMFVSRSGGRRWFRYESLSFSVFYCSGSGNGSGGSVDVEFYSLRGGGGGKRKEEREEKRWDFIYGWFSVVYFI